MDNSTAPATTEQLPDIIDRIQAWWITSSLDDGSSLSAAVMQIPYTEYRRERLTTWIREMGRPAAIAALRAHAKSPAEIAELEKAAQEQAEGTAPNAEPTAADIATAFTKHVTTEHPAIVAAVERNRARRARTDPAAQEQSEAAAAPATCEAYVLRTPGEGDSAGTCDAPAVGLRYNTVTELPYPVCAEHKPEIVTTPTPAADRDDSTEVPTTAQVRRAVAGSGWRDVTVAGFDAWLAARDARPTVAPQPTAELAAGFVVLDHGDAYEAEGGDTFWRECFCTDGKHAAAHRRETTDDVHQAMTWARNSGAHVLELQAYVVVIELQL